MNKSGDVVMIFGNPVKLESPIDEAKLIEKKSDLPGNLEEWWIEYPNDPGRQYVALIKKQEDKEDNLSIFPRTKAQCTLCYYRNKTACPPICPEP